ncbi:GalNAc(5)-diNAcBac-PP-undecaprenol beta-1,3-glucosyltransferase [Halioglobus japonicus]|nr:GalNAc(5)-diNAcBac-PP-undecaprenol beta-1,3-glucosyltransferase [Halioglobus japonicus]
MASDDEPPFFSIVIPTRDRPALFQVALRSVLQQRFVNKEIIVVVDGSSDENLAQYTELEQQNPDVTFLRLLHRPNGHGQSYTMNLGADESRGQYLCFLDDDDQWTDDNYLDHVYTNITAAGKPVDIHYSNQRAVDSNGVMQTKNLWLADLIPRAQTQTRNGEDSYLVDAEFLLSSGGFAHLNCSIFERTFYFSLNGMDESIRYENDRDVYIRSIDAAKVILYSTRYTSLHNIPDVNAKNNMSTVNSSVQKKLYQLRVYDKGIALCEQDIVIRFCCMGKMYELKHTATLLAQDKRYRSAAQYARATLLNGFNLRWLAYTVYLTFKAWFDPGSPSHDNDA